MNAGSFAYATPQQAQALLKLESLKKQGHNFIRVYYRGRQQRPQLHGYKSVSVFQEFDSQEAKQVWRTRIGDDPLVFADNGTGDLYADVYDCEHNRFALSRLLDFKSGNPARPMIEIDDPKVLIELRKLANKEYNVEPDRKTQLMRERALLDAEIAAMGDARPEPIMRPAAPEVAPIKEPEQTAPTAISIDEVHAAATQPKRRGRRPRIDSQPVGV
jgi:hypothetical protein